MTDPSSSDGLARLAEWPGDGRAAGWRRRGDAGATVAGDATDQFPIASVTKLLTATAVLVATQEEVLDLDEPAGPEGSTVRLLLCHASGLPVDGDAPVTPPATRRIYGNVAYERLGQLLAERSGMGWREYVDGAVLQPLAMESTTIAGSPAHGARSSVVDLLRFARELLEPGVVLAPEVLAEATTAQLPDLDGVLPGFGTQRPNPWGLGFELKGAKAPHWTPPAASPGTFGHFGGSGAFLWVDPVAGVACVGAGEQAFGDWAMDLWPALGTDVLAVATRG